MSYTLGEAAKAVGKSKTTIRRSLEKGRISGIKGDDGSWQIDPAELHRVYPMAEHVTVTGGTPEVTHRDEAFLAKIEARDREIELLRQQADDLREDRDHWRRQATALLTDNRTQERPGFWSRMFGK